MIYTCSLSLLIQWRLSVLEVGYADKLPVAASKGSACRELWGGDIPLGFYIFIIHRYERAEMLHYEMSFWAAKIRPGLILNIPESRQRDRNPTRSTLLNIPSSQVYSHTQWCCLCIDSLSLIISDVNPIATCYWQSSSRGVVCETRLKAG